MLLVCMTFTGATAMDTDAPSSGVSDAGQAHVVGQQRGGNPPGTGSLAAVLNSLASGPASNAISASQNAGAPAQASADAGASGSATSAGGQPVCPHVSSSLSKRHQGVGLMSCCEPKSQLSPVVLSVRCGWQPDMLTHCSCLFLSCICDFVSLDKLFNISLAPFNAE